jgi:hypothetical protein
MAQHPPERHNAEMQAEDKTTVEYSNKYTQRVLDPDANDPASHSEFLAVF